MARRSTRKRTTTTTRTTTRKRTPRRRAGGKRASRRFSRRGSATATRGSVRGSRGGQSARQMIEDTRQLAFSSAPATRRRTAPVAAAPRGRVADRARRQGEPGTVARSTPPEAAARAVPGKRLSVRRETTSMAELSRRTREESRRRSAAERSQNARFSLRSRIAPRSTQEVRRVGRLTVTTQARGRRREPKRGSS